MSNEERAAVPPMMAPEKTWHDEVDAQQAVRQESLQEKASEDGAIEEHL